MLYIKKVINKDHNKLVDLDLELIKSISNYLSINTNFDFLLILKLMKKRKRN